MTIQVKDLPQDQNETIATRLRDARTATGMSRRIVSEKTGIPQKTIEKFELGSQEPTISRLLTLSEVYAVSVDHILGINPDTPAPALEMPEDENAGGTELNDNKIEEAEEPVQMKVSEKIVAQLDVLNELRIQGFEGNSEKLSELIENTLNEIQTLEPEELIQIADHYGLFKDEKSSDCYSIIDFLVSPFKDEEGEREYCGRLEERILDAAILGVDLFSIEEAALIILADELEEEHGDLKPFEPAWMPSASWGDHDDFVPLIRPYLRDLAIVGTGIYFDDLVKYPRKI